MSSSEAMLAIALVGILLQSLALGLGLWEYRRSVDRPKKEPLEKPLSEKE